MAGGGIQEILARLGDVTRVSEARLTDKIYVHIDMDVFDPREVMGHDNNRMITGAVKGVLARGSGSR